MKTVRLVRLQESIESGTFGVLLYRDEMCFTLEPPDQGNAVNISSIPAGRYICSRVKHKHFGETYKLVRVPGRSGIYFHKGNWKEDTEGCILLGATVGEVDRTKKKAIKSSKMAFDRFMLSMKDEKVFRLVIEESY